MSKNKINLKTCFVKKSTDDNDDEKLNRIEREFNNTTKEKKNSNNLVDIGYVKILEDKINNYQKSLDVTILVGDLVFVESEKEFIENVKKFILTKYNFLIYII